MGVTVVKRTRLSPEERQERDRDRYLKRLNKLTEKAVNLETEIETATQELRQINVERIKIQRVLKALGGIEDDVEEEQGK
jgi:uncharacterized protein YlxW (UPF0749 family)